MPEDETALEFLSSAFPQTPKEVLQRVFEECNYDVGTASAHLAASDGLEHEDKNNSISSTTATTTTTDYKIQSVKDMFPTIDRLTIEKALRDCEWSVDKAADELLLHAFANQVELNEPERNQQRQDFWSSAEEEISRLASLTMVDKTTAKTYYHKNNAVFVEALIDIVFNRIADLEKQRQENRSKSTQTVTEIPLGGRVQTNFLAKTYNPPTSTTMMLQESSKDEGTFEYDVDNPNVKELAEFVYSSDLLVDISWKFYESAITLLKGNVAKVIEVAFAVIDSDAAALTYKTSPIKPRGPMNKSIQPQQLKYIDIRSDVPIQHTHFTKQQPQPQPQPQQQQRTLSDTEQDLDDNQVNLQRTQLQQAYKDNILDLHGFHVKNAQRTVSKAAQDWWEDEIKQREYTGNTVKGFKAREVDPLVIVTGRGIHSDSGVSKIRATVKRILTQEGYLFEEESSRFTLTGKRT